MAAVVLNWRDAASTLRCVESLREEILAGKICVIVCDNASEDQLEDALGNWAAACLGEPEGCSAPRGDRPEGIDPERAPALTMVQTGRNGGYAYGNNCGLRVALGHAQFDFIWILNNDTVVEPGSVDALLAHASANSQAGAIGSTILDQADAAVLQCAGGFRYFPAIARMRPVGKGMSPEALLRDTCAEQIRLDYVYGAAMLLRTEALRRVGLLNEEFFLYYEELDLARRLRRAGYRLSWCPGSRVRHGGGTSSGARESAEARQYHEQLSALRFTRRHYPALLPVVLLLRLFGKPLVMFFRGRREYIPAAMRAARDFFRAREAPRGGV